MPTTYLELSDDAQGQHKFWELTQKGADVTVRFGRIGTDGTAKTKTHASPADAKADAQKQIAAKMKKGYGTAKKGGREKKSVLTGKAPVVWKFKCSRSALGVYVDDQRCWAGDEGGKVYALDPKGALLDQYDLGSGVKAIVADERWIYAGNDDGEVIDLSRKVPTVAYQIKSKASICWMEIFQSTLLVSDDGGKLFAFDHEGDPLWNKKTPGRLGWLCRADADGVYHGNGGWSTTGVVAAYSWKGRRKWMVEKVGPAAGYGVGFGWQEADKVYAANCGWGKGTIEVFAKKDGKKVATCKCDDGMLSCAASPGGEYIFGGDGKGYVYCFNAKGQRQWKLATQVGSAQSMQFHDDKLYIVTDKGWFACIDLSESVIERAARGQLPTAKKVAAKKTPVRRVGDKLETSSTGSGVIVECRKEGSRVRVFPVSDGYHADWKVQFPTDLRQDGKRFVVDELVEATQGGFYRAVGEIRLAGAGAGAARPATKQASSKAGAARPATKQASSKAVAKTKKKAVKKKAVTKKMATKKKATKKKATKKKR